MTKGASPTRPLSPHLQIWRFTVTMAASITHRATGAVLYGGTLLLAAWLFAAASNPMMFAGISAIIHSPIGVVIIAGYVWAIMFHAMNGLRHLYWDSGRGLAPKTAKVTSWVIYVGSLLLAAIILWAGYAANGGA
ncbi:MAG: succinate dehydrogenase, cytochrome b556 subunit [Alphaproteobacteria bacterium]|nr:succinate dehydrogenase, cytochrome b556 subunit [Marinicaulis sp.]NOX94280.1 succinate dehydrogenase, cytochrome b556 subunit [Alphaproteobacteria bacterium]